MAIVARTLEGITFVAVTPASPLPLPEPANLFALYAGSESQGARLLDDTALGVRVFSFPAIDLRIIFEPTRIRLEATKPHKPEELALGEHMDRIVSGLYPKIPFTRYGFNYDLAYQYDAVIPQRHIMQAFMDEETVERATHFGWQCTLAKDKGKRRETYFFKVVSPLELRVLANIEFDSALPRGKETQAAFVRCYTEAQGIAEHLTFS